MRAGASKADITPPVGIKMGGFAARYKASEGVHDRLYSRALYLRGDRGAILLISNDLLNVPNFLVEEIKSEMSRKAGLERNQIMICATHTHSGPSLVPDLSSDIPTEAGDICEAYIHSLRSKIVQVSLQSMANTRTAKLGWGIGKASISFNRRIENGPVDPEVGTILVTDEFGVPMASLVNYACHGVVLGSSNYLMSADYPGAVSSEIESRFGPKHVSLFTNGATGDLNPLTSKGYACKGTFEDVERLGKMVADVAIEAMSSIQLIDQPILLSISEMVRLSLVRPSEEKAVELIEGQKKVLSDLQASGAGADEIMENVAILSYYRKNLRLIRKGLMEDEVPVEVQAMRIGDSALVGLPVEPFVEVGLRIKSGSPIKPTFIVSYANGYNGYMPVSEAYEQGGYEVTPTYWNRLSKGSAEMVIQKAISLLKKLK